MPMYLLIGPLRTSSRQVEGWKKTLGRGEKLPGGLGVKVSVKSGSA